MFVYFWAFAAILIMILIFVVVPKITNDAWAIRSETKMRSALKESDVHLNSFVGKIESINGIPASELIKLENIYGCPAGALDIEILVSYTKNNIKGASIGRLHLLFNAEKGHSYSLNIVSTDPKEDSSLYYYTPLASDKHTFKSPYYFIVKDITTTKDATDLRRL